MRWPLRYQILVPFTLTMLAVVLGVSVLDAVLAARRSQTQIENQLRGVSQTLLDGNFPLTDGVLRQTRGLSGAEFLLVDRAGNRRAGTLALVAPELLANSQPQDGSFALTNLVEVAGEQYFHTAVAVGPRGLQSEPMRLHILYPRGALREARWQAAYPPLAIGALLLPLTALLSVVIAARVTRPLLQLRGQLGRLVQGQFEPLALPQRNDELRDLVASVNQLAAQLDELRRVIKRSERLALLGQLSGGLAHQLRNSVTGARIAVQLHKRRCAADDQDSLAVALRQLTITESHLQRFLSAGQPSPPRREACRIAPLVSEVVDLVQPACTHRGVELQLPPDLEALSETLGPLWADPEQLRMLLMNLLLNAIEAAGTGGWVRVEVDARDRLRLRVLDSGPGLAPELDQRLFEPFATTKPEGIGLGLAVARQIAAAHGGTIEYTRGSATCFEFGMPLVRQQATSPVCVTLAAAPEIDSPSRATSEHPS